MPTAELQALTDDVAERLHSPTVLEDDEQRVVVYSAHTTPVDDVRRESILRRETSPEIRDWFRRYGITTATEPIRTPSERTLGILGRLCVPVRHQGMLTGFLWLIDDRGALDTRDVAVALATARHAGAVMYEDLLAERMASTAVEHLLSASDELRSAAAAQIQDAGLLGDSAPVAVAVVRLAGSGWGDHAALLGEALRDVTRRHPRGQLIGTSLHDHGALIVQGAPGHDPALRTERIGRGAREAVRRRLAAMGDEGCVVLGVGDPQERPADAYLSYRQARMAAQIALARGADTAVWSDLGAHRALALLPGHAAVSAAIDPRVDRMVRELSAELIGTLREYLERAGDVQATTQRLHISRGTLYYRLQKVERGYGVDLHDGRDRLAVHLGLELTQLRAVL